MSAIQHTSIPDRCQGCAKSARAGNCLNVMDDRLQIHWADTIEAKRCKAYQARTIAQQTSTDAAEPLRLPAGGISADEQQAYEIRRLRTARFKGPGEAVAIRLLERDREGDTRGLCIECRYIGLQSGVLSCNNRTLKGSNIVGKLFAFEQMQRCPGRKSAALDAEEY